MLLVDQAFTMIPTFLPSKPKGTNEEKFQSRKIPVVDKQHWACQRGPLLQRRQVVLQAIVTPAVVAMRVCQPA
jgi:hypothetical protein